MGEPEYYPTFLSAGDPADIKGLKPHQSELTRVLDMMEANKKEVDALRETIDTKDREIQRLNSVSNRENEQAVKWKHCYENANKGERIAELKLWNSDLRVEKRLYGLLFDTVIPYCSKTLKLDTKVLRKIEKRFEIVYRNQNIGSREAKIPEAPKE